MTCKALQISIAVDTTDLMLATLPALITILDLQISHSTGQDKIDAMAERALLEIHLMGLKARKELCS